MYQAKRSGGHQIAIYDAGLHADLLRRRQLGDDLRAALRSDRVWVAYQPLVDLGTGRWCGAEALARWTHPRLGPVPPDEFIPIAEQSDLIHALGRRVLVAAVDAAVTARSAVGDFVVSVNVSTRQLDSPNTCQAIADALDGSGLPAAALCLELTESSLADDSQAERALGDLRHLGVRTSIDDFGTGCSSLAQLRTLPVDELKIDRSFIAPVSADREARHLVDGIIGLAHSLGLQVVAEGVETAVQADILADLGCDRAQGYYYRRPAPLPEFLDALPPAHRPAT